MNVFFWAIITVVFVIAEIATVQLVSIWFAAGAFVTMLCTYFMDFGVIGQLGVFILSSAVFLLMTFPFIKKKRSVSHVGTNHELDVGKTALVIEDIHNETGTGRVRLNGVDWSAVSADGDAVIPKDTIVTIVRVDGAKLEVTVNK